MITKRPPSPAAQQRSVDRWNAKHAVGTAVRVRLDSGEVRQTRTRAAAELLGGHAAVVWLDGIAMSDPLPPDVQQAIGMVVRHVVSQRAGALTQPFYRDAARTELLGYVIVAVGGEGLKLMEAVARAEAAGSK